MNINWNEALKIIQSSNAEIKKQNEELYLTWSDDQNLIINEDTYETIGVDEVPKEWKESEWIAEYLT